MIVGLPGAGISTFFYLFAVLLMPARLVWLALHGRLTAGMVRMVVRMWLVAAGVIVAFWLIGLVLAAMIGRVTIAASGGLALTESGAQVIARVGIWLAIGTLVAVLAVIRILATIEERRRAEPRGPGALRMLVLVAVLRSVQLLGHLGAGGQVGRRQETGATQASSVAASPSRSE